jgi:ABC-2 type transport system permease protein
MTRYLRLMAIQARISAASAMAYRTNFLVEGAISVVWLAITLLPLKVLFDHRAAVAGWTAPSALVVISYFMAVRAVLEGMISPSLADLVGRIRSGSFDYVLLKPVDAQAMISASHYEPWRIFDLIGAIAVAVYAFSRIGAPPSAAAIALGIAMFGAGLAAAYSLWIACAAAAFWLGRLDNLMYLLGSIFDTARWPITVFPGLWRFVFTFIVPVAIMTTYPAQALLGTLDARTAIATVGGAATLLLVSRLVWRLAIRNYTSASS